MKWSLALASAVIAVVCGSYAAPAQAPQPVQCNDFIKLRTDAQQKAMAIHEAGARKADRKEMCTLFTRFSDAEAVVLKFLIANKTWCGIPDEAIKATKANHERTLKVRTAACTEAPAAQPRQPTLSDFIGTQSVDTGANTRTGRGTLDSLSGNPLAK